MGKHERDWAEEVEKNTTAGIRGEAVDTADKKISDAIREYVEANYNQSVKTANWVGAESYDDAGDIHVFLADDTKIPVELKTSKKSGSGTKANPSSNILKKYIKGAVNYPDFDNNLGLRKQRYDLVEGVVGRKLEKKAHYEKVLRELRKVQPNVLVEVAAIAAPGQRAYAEYASELLNNNLSATQSMVNDILKGDNTQQQSATDNLVYCVVKKYQTKKQTVEFYDFSQMDSEVAKVVPSGKQIKIQNKAGHDILRFSVSWKNICAGGANPCFNVFVGNAFQ